MSSTTLLFSLSVFQPGHITANLAILLPQALPSKVPFQTSPSSKQTIVLAHTPSHSSIGCLPHSRKAHGSPCHRRFLCSFQRE
ncbi:unnamed protein product [Linum tenue]|uniref:Secreted protein n=1 Tax=Linum tenue TaxID=586396 RepID=A0AAV0S200_9ROSI|nr:unnamed protein product [Linum tenue]